MTIEKFLPVGRTFRYKSGCWSVTPPSGLCISLGVLRYEGDYWKLLLIDDRGEVFEHRFDKDSGMSTYPQDNFELL